MKQDTLLKIRASFFENPNDYKAYEALGDYYFDKNPKQAYLCYEQAKYYCREEADTAELTERMGQLEAEGNSLNGVSVVILSYNATAEIKLCIDSIKDSVSSDAVEIIVVDMGSDAEALEALRSDATIKLIEEPDTISMAAGYNIGIREATPSNDILLLHNDMVVVPNALFWLRMGLYENERVGGTGGVTNLAQNYQQIAETYATPNEYLIHGMQNNVLMEYPYEKKLQLLGFCWLIKRQALEAVGKFDETFLATACEEDMSCRMVQAGYELCVCKNAFVYHFGTESIQKKVLDYRQALIEDSQKSKEKWNFDYRYYTYERRNLVDIMGEVEKTEIRILEIGCGMGATLGYLQNKYPSAEVYGIELMENVAGIGQKYLPNIIAGNIEYMEIPYEENFFDYIICADVLEHLHEPERIVSLLGRYLKPDGSIIASIPNIMHYSVMLDLLKGNFTYQDSGILDRTHLHFFTLNEILRMFAQCRYKVDVVTGSTQNVTLSQEDQMMYDALLKVPGIAPTHNFQTYQYFIKADIQK